MRGEGGLKLRVTLLKCERKRERTRVACAFLFVFFPVVMISKGNQEAKRKTTHKMGRLHNEETRRYVEEAGFKQAVLEKLL